MGKLSAILPDAQTSSGSGEAFETLLSISGRDEQSVDRKGVAELPKVRILTRFTIAVNKLPQLPDEVGTIKPRLLLLHFSESFAGREDTTRKDRLLAEAPGVAAWALQGLRRLRIAGQFTEPAKSLPMREEFKSNPRADTHLH